MIPENSIATATALFALLVIANGSPSHILEGELPGLPDARYSRLGDVNIGIMLNILDKSDTTTCSESLKKSPFVLESTEAISFAVDLVNEDPHVLPNTTLGFVIEGVCSIQGVNLLTAMRFIPQHGPYSNQSGSSLTAEAAASPSSSSSPWVHHDVVGILTPGTSSYAISVSYILGVGKVPMIGPKETNNALSGKNTHPYFFRLVPPDKYQVRAILRFISSYGWSYISVVYHSGSYGQDAFDEIKELSGHYGVCIAASIRLIPSNSNYQAIVSELLATPRARVVVLFTYAKYFAKVLQATADENATGHFIWIGSDSMASYNGYDYNGLDFDPGVGTFVFNIFSSYVVEFYDYLKRQKAQTSINPFFKPSWEWMFDCSFSIGTCDEDAEILLNPKYFAYSGTSLRIDAIKTFAQAIHNLLSQKCPDVKGADARACVNGPVLNDYMKNVTVNGFNGRIEFDENQDLKGRYIISQLVHGDFKFPFLSDTNASGVKRVFEKGEKIYDIVSDSLIDLPGAVVSWDHLNNMERVVPWTAESLHMGVPESVCSRPCLVGEYKIEKEVPCCWDCVKCRDNERLVEGNTSCRACPEFSWPDPKTAYTSCTRIPPTFSSFPDPMPLVFTSLAGLALMISTIVMIFYYVYRDKRVIKASSRELSVIQLVAIFLGYLTIIMFQIRPNDHICVIVFFLFCTSFALLYCPLLVKTIRIYRIFKSGAKNKRPRFISPNSQLAFTASLIAIQAGFCVATYILFEPRAIHTQPIWSEKFVELSCDLTLPGLASFLGYNTVLVSLCSVFAFMVRNLPDNFNESKFISMCVSTTLLIWLAFIPTFFTADREFVRTFLLSTALLLNHTVALIFLFIPKIYAAAFLPPETSEFSNKRS